MATILVVDDRPLNRQFLVTLLGYCDHRVLEAANGLEALDLVREQRPDLVISDLVMPVMDGQALAQALRADAALAHVPVIFYTATYQESEALRIGASCGVRRVLRKPSDPELILAAVHEALQSSPHEAGLRSLPAHIGAAAMPRPSELFQSPSATHLASILDLALIFAQQRDVASLLDAFRVKSAPLMKADCMAVGVLDEHCPDRLRMFVSSGLDDATVRALRALPASQGALGRSVATRCAIRLNGGSAAEAGLPPSHPPLMAFLALPLASAFNTYGWIYWTRCVGASFSEDDERIATAIAAQFVVAFENLVLLDEVQTHAAQLREEVGQRRRAEQALEEAGRRKDDFLATLAHELRNPLAPIASSLEIMGRAPDDPTRLERARTIMERQVKHMARLVDDLLDLARLNTGKLRLRKAPCELTEIVTGACESARVAFAAKGHSLCLTAPPAPIPLDADAARLSQVFMNLVNNACQYTEPGGRIDVRIERERDQAVVKVRDSGIGIPPERLETVFEMFAQLHTGSRASQQGLGIGLNLARRLVEKHGGTITASSAGTGGGSEFVVRLPTPPQLAQDPHVAGVSRPLPEARRILVVDDNRDAATSMAELLNLMGHDVRTAYDGLAGVAAAEDFRPDLVLLDLGMPVMDGYQTAREIRKREWGSAVLLVALSGWSQEENIRKTREAGFDDHLVKPLEFAQLERLLGQRAGGPSR